MAVRYPLRSIFPVVVGHKTSGLGRDFLGTGFFIRGDGTFLTAKHVFEGIRLAGDEAYGIAFPANDPVFYWASDIAFCEHFDIALARAVGIKDIVPLQVASKNAPMNRDVLTVEFSGTTSERLAEGHEAIVFSPYFRKGHVIRYYTSDYPESIPTKSLDLSYPALKGASGAPVYVDGVWEVVGMLVANVERPPSVGAGNKD